jgi:hypothetical protein
MNQQGGSKRDELKFHLRILYNEGHFDLDK